MTERDLAAKDFWGTGRLLLTTSTLILLEAVSFNLLSLNSFILNNCIEECDQVMRYNDDVSCIRGRRGRRSVACVGRRVSGFMQRDAINQ